MGTILGLDKPLEIAARGLGAAVGPLLAPWRARREGRARIIAAEADAKVLEIRAEAYATHTGGTTPRTVLVTRRARVPRDRFTLDARRVAPT